MRFLSPNTDSSLSYYDKVRYIIIWRLVLLFTFVFFILSAIFSQIHFQGFIIYFIVFCLSLFTAIYIKKTGRFLFAYWVFTFSASVLVTYSLNTLNFTLHYSDIFWIIATILFAYIGLGKKWAIAIIMFHTLSLIYFVFFVINGNIAELKPLDITEKIGVAIEIIFGVWVISYLFRLYEDFKDYSEKELQDVNQELALQNKIILSKNTENTTLVKEIHHRVKNNLQIVISLLRMQSQDVESIETKKHFSEAINRIMAISLIHQKLYEEKQFSNIVFRNYFEELCNDIKSLHSNRIEILISYNTELTQMGLKTIVPLGLLLNELITNSLKHAFKSHSHGSITIDFTSLDEYNIVLEYSDTGVWKNNTNLESNFGLELITLLSEQMEGEFIRKDSKYVFQLKNIDQL